MGSRTRIPRLAISLTLLLLYKFSSDNEFCVASESAAKTQVYQYKLAEPVFSTEFSTASPFNDYSSSSFRSLTLLTYNVWNFNDGPKWEERKIDIANVILSSNADFVSLNEIRRQGNTSRETKNMFTDMEKLLGPHGYSGAFQPAMYYGNIDTVEGVAFFTKLNFIKEEVTATHLHFQGVDVADRNKRVCLQVPLRLENPNSILHAFVTHFSYDAKQQQSNAKGIVHFLKETQKKASSKEGSQFEYVLLGDLNGGENEATKYLEDEGKMKDSWTVFNVKKGYEDINESNGNTYCNCKYDTHMNCKLRRRIDHILLKESPAIVLRHVEVGPGPETATTKCPSDHRAYIARIDFKNQNQNEVSKFQGFYK